MSKVLTDKELGQIIYDATHDPGVIDCADSYRHFLEELGLLICDHFGGELGNVYPSDGDNLAWFVYFEVNECVPANGGVFAKYDTDVTWEDGVEVEASEERCRCPGCGMPTIPQGPNLSAEEMLCERCHNDSEDSDGPQFRASVGGGVPIFRMDHSLRKGENIMDDELQPGESVWVFHPHFGYVVANIVRNEVGEYSAHLGEHWRFALHRREDGVWIGNTWANINAAAKMYIKKEADSTEEGLK